MANELIEEKTIKTPKQKVWFGVRIALNVIFYTIILLVLLFSISNIRAKNENDRIPNVFGLGYLNVLSDSMDGDFDNSFKAGDMIIVKTASEKKIAKLKVGDIVTFLDYNLQSNKGASTALNTHRIVYINKEANIFYTVGDKAMKLSNGFDITTLNDDNCLSTLQQVFGVNGFQAFGSSEIRGIYSGKWSGFGSVIQTINNHFVAIIIVPIAILLVLELGYLIYNIMKVREEKLKKDLKPEADLVMTDDDKEKLKAELRAQLLAEMGVAPSTDSSQNEEKLEEEPEKDNQEETPSSEEILATETEDTPVSEEESVIEESLEDETKSEPQEETVSSDSATSIEASVPTEETIAETKVEEAEEALKTNEEKSESKKTPAKKTTTAKKTASTTKKTTTSTTAKKTTTKKADSTASKKSTTASTAKKTTASTTTKKTTTKKADSTASKKSTTTSTTKKATKKSEANE